MQSLVCLDGELMPPDEARVSVWDRGFLFGDAVYEVFRLYEGRGWLEDEHMARLARSLNELQLAGVDLRRLTERIHRTVSASEISDGTVYIQITRGAAPRKHAFPAAGVEPTELISAAPYDDTETAERRQTGVAAVSFPDLRWKRCDVKSTNLLANVLANEAAQRAGAYEAVLVEPNGIVTEATHSSLLWVRQGRLSGTPDGPGILPGTTRQFILRLAAEIGLPFEPAQIRLDDLKAADEVLLAGTTIEVLPVISIDGARIPGPGPWTRRLQSAFTDAVAAWLAPEPV